MWEADSVYGTAADVYSFGLLVLECWTGNNPFYPYEFTWILDFMERVRKKEVVPGIGNLPDHTPVEVRDLTVECLDWNPARRPAFSRIVRVLDRPSLIEALSGSSGMLAHAADVAAKM
jgi:hypothetical protein